MDAWCGELCGSDRREEKRKHELTKSVDVVFKINKSKGKNIPKPIDGHQLWQTNTILETAIGAIRACLTFAFVVLIIFGSFAKASSNFGVSRCCASRTVGITFCTIGF